MDALSGVASVIAVVQLAAQIGGALKTYYQGVRDAREDIDRLYNSLSSLQAFLEKVEGLAADHQTILASHDASVKNATGPLRLLQVELEKLDQELDVTKVSGKLGRLAQRLKWPLKKDEVDSKVDNIERFKSSLALDIELNSLTRVRCTYEV